MLGELLRRASFWLLMATLVVLPFEFVLPDDHVLAGYTLTSLEVVGLVALGAWLASLALDRRLPALATPIAVALAGLLAVVFASALLAPGLSDQALDAAVHLAAGGVLFVAVADIAARNGRPTWLATAVVLGATASALVGIASFAFPSINGPLGLGDFSTIGARRLAGTLDYPNAAAMYYEASSLVAIGLALAVPRLVLRVAFCAAAVVLIAAMILTLSRGALLGLCAGLAVVAFAAVAASTMRRRRAWLVAGSAALVALALAMPLALARTDGPVANPPLEQFNAGYAAPASGTLRDGQMIVPVSITNTGSAAWNSDGADRFLLGFHWLPPDATRLLGDGFDLSPIGPLRPGETKVVEAVVHALPPALGHVVAWDVLAPGQVWLSQYGVPVHTTQIVSLGRPGEVPLPQPVIAAQLDLYRDLGLPPTRDELWSAAAQMTAEEPLLGHGPGTFRLRYGPYLGLADWDTDIHANNMYLELSATIGLLGLATFLVVIALVAVPLLRRVFGPARTAARAETLFAAALAAALVAFMVHGAVDYFVGFNPTGGLFWAVLGLALYLGGPRTSADRRAP